MTKQPEVMTVDASEYRMNALLQAKDSQITFAMNEAANLRADLETTKKILEQTMKERDKAREDLARIRTKTPAAPPVDPIAEAARKAITELNGKEKAQ